MCRSVFGGTGVAQRSLPSDRPGIGLDRTAACASIVVTNREARTFSGLGIGTGSARVGLDPGCNLQGSVLDRLRSGLRFAGIRVGSAWIGLVIAGIRVGLGWVSLR